MNKKYYLYLAIVVGVLLRLALIPNPGFEADISFWKSWGLAAWDHGVVWSMHNTNNNYPTPFAYTLGIMVALYSRFADPYVFSEFWRNTNLFFLTIAKLFPIAADFGIAGLIVYIGRNAKRLEFPTFSFPIYYLLSAIYLLSPVALIDGAWWGQVDSLGVLLFLLAVIFLLSKRSFLAGALFMAAMMTKLQSMIYGPLFFLFAWQTVGFGGLVKAAAGSLVAFLGLNIEFLLAHDMGRVVQSLTENFDYFPYFSLNAFNLWWISAGGHGMEIIDKVASIGVVNAKTVGLILFSFFYLFTVIRQFIQKNIRTFTEGLITINAAFFLFMTESHDRYAFPLAVFLLLLAPFTKKRRLFLIFYALFTLLYFYNLHTALVLNYPHNGLPFLSLFTQPTLTIGVSYLLIALFLLFFIPLIRSNLIALFIPVGFGVFALVALNMPLLLHKPVLLSRLTPFESHQDYGNRMRDMAVNSSFGPNQWTRLSVQYAFYMHGIGTHANSKHVFDINKKFKKFSFDYGIDTEAGAKGTAIFEVWGEDKLLFRSDKVGRYNLPQHKEIDITGVRHLSLVTTDAGDGNTDDHTDWLNPTLWP